MSEETHARQLVVFRLGAEHYALPIRQVQESSATPNPARSSPPIQSPPELVPRTVAPSSLALQKRGTEGRDPFA